MLKNLMPVGVKDKKQAIKIALSNYVHVSPNNFSTFNRSSGEVFVTVTYKNNKNGFVYKLASANMFKDNEVCLTKA